MKLTRPDGTPLVDGPPPKEPFHYSVALPTALFSVYAPFEIELARAQGCYVYDERGTEYLDLYGGHGVISIGHSNARYVDAVQGQVYRVGFYSNSIKMPLQEQLAYQLRHLSGYTDYNLFLCNSGAEATENALKTASFQTGRRGVAAFHDSFHGRTGLALNVTDNPKIRPPMVEGSFPVDFFCIGERERLAKLLRKEQTAAVIIEGIQGVGGLNAPDADYLRFLREICTETGTLLILDEVQSGYGRSGKFFAHQIAEDVRPDLIALAKGMGNGFPIGGVLMHPDVRAFGGMLGTTFGGNHLACAAGLAVLEVIRTDQLTERAAQMGTWLRGKLKQIPGVRRVKGRGLMLGPEFDFPVAELRKTLLHDHHIFTGNSKNPHLLRILPPLIVGENHLVPFLDALREAVPRYL